MHFLFDWPSHNQDLNLDSRVGLAPACPPSSCHLPCSVELRGPFGAFYEFQLHFCICNSDLRFAVTAPDACCLLPAVIVVAVIAVAVAVAIVALVNDKNSNSNSSNGSCSSGGEAAPSNVLQVLVISFWINAWPAATLAVALPNDSWPSCYTLTLVICLILSIMLCDQVEHMRALYSCKPEYLVIGLPLFSI